MELLHWIESIRTDWLDRVVLAITELGTEYAFAAVALWLLWCHNKKQGFRLFPVFFVGMTLCEALKGLLHVARPWVQDPTLRPVDAALEDAYGYSCPSGHSLTAGCSFGGGALAARRGWLKGLLWFAVALVMLSRVYLGVHTLVDVLAGLALALVCLLAMQGLYALCDKGKLKDGWIYAGLCVLATAAVVLTQTDLVGSAHQSDAPKLLGAALGLLAAYWLEGRYIRFSTEGTGWQQAIKYAVGLGLTVGLLKGLKAVFALAAPGFWAMDAVRYCLVVLFAAAVWPLTFPLIRRIGGKKTPAACTNFTQTH